MGFETSMFDEQLVREQKIILCSGFATIVLGIGGFLFILPPHQSMPTSYMFEKAKQQPSDVIVLHIVKGIEYEERMLVRIYKTAPFVLLKNDLRDKDDTVSELAIKNPEGGEFPVFDNDTPLS
ncbi:hypothetical protein KCU77_g9622, partial [Aureobasidium melanogenum]